MNRKIYSYVFVLWLISFYCINAQVYKVKSNDGVEIAYTKAGDGDLALVFVHGWSCNKSYWDEQIKTFSPEYTVVAIDLGGFGESGKDRKDWTMQEFGEDVAAVVNKLRLKKVILIGHSMGGAVVLEAALRLKGKVIGLIGADTFQKFEDDMPAEQKNGYLKPFKENFKQTTKGFVKAMFPPTADTALVRKVAGDMSSADPAIAISAMKNLFFYDALPAIKELQLPLVSINCDLYPVSIDENKKYFKSYEVKIMHNVGHFVMLENPAEFDKFVQEAIDKILDQ